MGRKESVFDTPWTESSASGGYFLSDHLGNTRVVFGDYDKDGRVNPDPLAGNDVRQVVSGYYPFGAQHSNGQATTTPPDNQYPYNRKERQDELNLGWYDYGARMYDPTIARWNGVDALAEIYSGYSPFNYTLGNPISFTDPDGRSVENIILNAWNATPENGKATFKNGSSDGDDDERRRVDYQESAAFDPETGNHTFRRFESHFGFETVESVSQFTGKIVSEREKVYRGNIEYVVVISPDGKVISAKKIDENGEVHEMSLALIGQERGGFGSRVEGAASIISSNNNYSSSGHFNFPLTYLTSDPDLLVTLGLASSTASSVGFLGEKITTKAWPSIASKATGWVGVVLTVYTLSMATRRLQVKKGSPQLLQTGHEVIDIK